MTQRSIELVAMAIIVSALVLLPVLYTCALVPVLIPVSQMVERTSGFSCLRMCEIFPEIWETMLFWYSYALGLHISMLFWYYSACDDEFSSALVLRIYNPHKRRIHAVTGSHGE